MIDDSDIVQFAAVNLELTGLTERVKHKDFRRWLAASLGVVIS